MCFAYDMRVDGHENIFDMCFAYDMRVDGHENIFDMCFAYGMLLKEYKSELKLQWDINF